MLPIGLLALGLGGLWWDGLLLCVSVVVIYEWTMLLRKAAVQGRRVARGWVVVGSGYLGVAVFALLMLRLDPATGFGNVLFLLAMIWAADIGAYAAGRICGGPRLAPRISPGKTWSGAIGGVLMPLIVAMTFAAIGHGRFASAVTIAIVLAIVGQAGDLLESMIKRRAGVKDSGSLVPGHGGVLDRLDSLLAAAPCAALFAGMQWRGFYLWQ